MKTLHIDAKQTSSEEIAKLIGEFTADNPHGTIIIEDIDVICNRDEADREWLLTLLDGTFKATLTEPPMKQSYLLNTAWIFGAGLTFDILGLICYADHRTPLAVFCTVAATVMSILGLYRVWTIYYKP